MVVVVGRDFASLPMFLRSTKISASSVEPDLRMVYVSSFELVYIPIVVEAKVRIALKSLYLDLWFFSLFWWFLTFWLWS